MLFSGSLYAETVPEKVTACGINAKVTASSELNSSNSTGKYAPENAFDGNPATAWVEANSNNGTGEWIEVVFPDTVLMNGIVLYPGYMKTLQTLTENCIPSLINLKINNQSSIDGTIAFKEEFVASDGTQKKPLREGGCYPAVDSVNLSPRFLLFNNRCQCIQ